MKKVCNYCYNLRIHHTTTIVKREKEQLMKKVDYNESYTIPKQGYYYVQHGCLCSKKHFKKGDIVPPKVGYRMSVTWAITQRI